jgi:hypothetical protein
MSRLPTLRVEDMIVPTRAGSYIESEDANQDSRREQPMKAGVKRGSESLPYHGDDEPNTPLSKRSRRAGSSTCPSESEGNRRAATGNAYLCGHCRDLNLGALIRTVNTGERGFHGKKQYPAPWDGTWKGWGEEFHKVAKVGLHYRKPPSTKCLLCPIIISSRIKQSQGSEGVSDQELNEELYVGNYTVSNKLKLPSRPSSDRTVARLFLARQRAHDFDPCKSRHDTRPPKHADGAVLLQATGIPELLEPQEIPPAFDALIIKSWLRYCADNHRLLCDLEAIPMSGVQIINCITRLVENHDTKKPYVALSYVWATARDVCGNIDFVEGQRALPLKLSQVVEDCITVTKALGYQYLWIDKFCIDQNAADLKHEQIQQMDAIYQNSDLTIVAASGSDETYGLPGVNTTNRTRQLIARFGDVTVLQMPQDPHEAIAQAHWSSRGWTFQEAVLSRRRLVFTDDQVYFQCNTMNCFESNHFLLEDMHVENRSITDEDLRAGYFGNSKAYRDRYGKQDSSKRALNDIVCQYHSNLEDYTGRDLRFDEDALNAFQGIARRFTAHQRHPLYNLYGLVYSKDRKHGANILAHSLTWKHEDQAQRPRRRTMFPSWSWAGWKGQVGYDIKFTGGSQYETALAEVSFRALDGDELSFEELRKLEAPPAEGRYVILRLTASVIPTSVLTLRHPVKNILSWRINSCAAALAWSADSRTASELLESFRDTSRWQFIHIGSDGIMQNVMILEQRPGDCTWQRAGIFQVARHLSLLTLLKELPLRMFDIA